MAKKMAIKKEPKQRKLNFSSFRAGKAIFRIGFLSLVFAVAIFSIKGLHSVYATMWPVKKIAIQNEVKYVDKHQLRAEVESYIDEGMWAIDLSALQARIKKIDWIKNVEIRKVWPDQLILVIEENQPLVNFGKEILTQSGSKIVIGETREWMNLLPKVELHDGLDASAQELRDIWDDYRAIRRSFELINLKLSHLEIDEINNWLLLFDDGLNINLGRKQQKERVERLISVFGEINNKQLISRIDLRYNNGFAIENKIQDEDLNG